MKGLKSILRNEQVKYFKINFGRIKKNVYIAENNT